jgi:ribosomal protein L7Ae-like RNA K-turn-binding protein
VFSAVRLQEELRREQPRATPPPGKVATGERELTTGLLSKSASFRLIVSGDVGVKEIERLIAKLQLDKEILADADGGNDGQ